MFHIYGVGPSRFNLGIPRSLLPSMYSRSGKSFTLGARRSQLLTNGLRLAFFSFFIVRLASVYLKEESEVLSLASCLFRYFFLDVFVSGLGIVVLKTLFFLSQFFLGWLWMVLLRLSL